MTGYIDLKKLNLDELVGVVNLYPWFGRARKELCLRMSRMGADMWGESQFAEAAMYLPSRRILSDLIRSAKTQDWGDADVEAVIKSYIAADHNKKQDSRTPSRKVYAGAGDYFTQEDYDKAVEIMQATLKAIAEEAFCCKGAFRVYGMLERKIVDIVNSFKGSYMQEVPKYSAVKVNGKKLYG